MATAEQINDDKHYPTTLVETIEGYRGVRFYRVRAGSREEALAADGMPRIGDPWSAELGGVLVRQRDARAERAGGDWIVVRVDYETNTGQIPSVGPGVISRVVPSTTTRNVNFDVDGTTKLTSDGRGVPRIVTVTLFEVVRYFQAMPDLSPYRNITDEPKVNDATVVLPNLFGSGQNLQIGPGELLYAKYTPDRVGELFEIRSELHWRRDWKHHKLGEEPSGEPSGSDTPLDIYETGDFSGLL